MEWGVPFVRIPNTIQESGSSHLCAKPRGDISSGRNKFCVKIATNTLAQSYPIKVIIFHQKWQSFELHCNCRWQSKWKIVWLWLLPENETFEPWACGKILVKYHLVPARGSTWFLGLYFFSQLSNLKIALRSVRKVAPVTKCRPLIQDIST